MENIIQKELLKGTNIINLPCGEFKENVIIDRPCTIIGNNTTLWNENLPVIVVQSSGVVLKNLRLELTSISGFESNYPVLKLQDDTITENVEIFGGLADTQKYYIPRMIHLGKVKSNCESSFILRVYLPEDCIVNMTSNKFTLSTNILHKGYSVLTIKVPPLDDNSMIYGEILFISKLIRRVYIDGYVSNQAQQNIRKEVYSYDNINPSDVGDVILLNIPKVDSSPIIQTKPNECKVLTRGERCILDTLNLIIKLDYTQSSGNKIDIDPYIFLTDNSNITRYNEDMIFFGNTNAYDMSICIQNDNSIITDLTKIPSYVNKISICYSIYKGGYYKNFSNVSNPVVSIYDLNNQELFKIPLENLGYLSTVIVAELYKYKNNWKINPVIAGYNNGLPKLCQSFGIDAEY